MSETTRLIDEQIALIDKWNRLLEGQVAQGASPGDAKHTLTKRYPVLASRAIAQANSQPQPKQDAVQVWDGLIADRVAAGETRAAAIRTLVANCPSLHREYLRQYTAEHNTRPQ